MILCCADYRWRLQPWVLQPSAPSPERCPHPSGWRRTSTKPAEVINKGNQESSLITRASLWEGGFIKRTYRFSISLRSWGSSSGVTDRSAMDTWADAVSVTSSTTNPRASSSGSSRWCVCSLARVERSSWHLGQHRPLTWTQKTHKCSVTMHKIQKPSNWTLRGDFLWRA